LISLCANVLFLEERNGEKFIIQDLMYIIQNLINISGREKSIYDLYHDYFFRRQDHLWYEKAMEKLPMILNATKC
jgi:4-alpha-glucanotransferase